MLFVLRIAETVAEEFVVDMTGLPPFDGDIETAGNTPLDALSLALRLRALAAVLGLLLQVSHQPDGLTAPQGFASGSLAQGFARRSGGRSPVPHDTS